MDIAIRYYSKTGHTKKLAQAISEVTNVEALSISHKLESNVDILFLGTSIYGNSIDPQIPGFFDSIDVKVDKIVNFSTAGTNISTYDKIKQLASQYDIELSQQEFHCLGEFGGMNLDKPDSNDIENIKEFTRNII